MSEALATLNITDIWRHTRKVWLIGGTSESVTLADRMQANQIPFIVTVTTTAAQELYRTTSKTWVQHVCFSNDDALHQWVQKSGVTAILDASHPFATEISERAMRIARLDDIAYLRFERASVATTSSAHVVELNGTLSEISPESLCGQRVLLTVGSRSLGMVRAWHDRAELFARIMPDETAVRLAYQAGFSRDHLIALRPPLSFNLECALWQHWQISLAVTKASGPAGGEEIKRQVAETLQVPLWVVKRPQIDYPWQTQSIQTAIHFCQTKIA